MRATIRTLAALAICLYISPTFAAGTDWSAVAAALGRKASVLPGGVHKFGFPRTDLRVSLDGVSIQPAFALGGWLAFKEVRGRALVMGDLVLLEDEVGPVMKRLADSGVKITALHNHLLRARPFPMYMHVRGEGDAVTLAKRLRNALDASNTPLGAAPAVPASSAGKLDTAALDQILGRHGSANGTVYHFGIPRAETIETELDGASGADRDERSERMTSIPPSMGTAIGINFEPTGSGKAAITGDFPLTAREVNPVLRALVDNGIEVTALHTHMLGERPHLFFMHFWANGDAETLARGLKAALDHVNVKR